MKKVLHLMDVDLGESGNAWFSLEAKGFIRRVEFMLAWRDYMRSIHPDWDVT